MIRWLQVGYPDGVPGPDRVPLMALLRSTPLTEDQIREVVRNITAQVGSPETVDHPIDRDEIACAGAASWARWFLKAARST